MMEGKVCGVILNGGGSTRMGSDKSALSLGALTPVELITSTLAQLTDTIVVNQNYCDHPRFLTIPDRFKNAGPLSGVHAVMKARSESWFVLAPCDTPFIMEDVYRKLMSEVNHSDDVVIPVHGYRLHPLSGVYHRRIFPQLETYLSNGGRKVIGLFDKVKVKKVHTFPGVEAGKLARHFFNMNTPEEYAKAKDLLESWNK
ncbi:molybdenum cofactor guanylyltransferase [Halobacillus karajensis]|uniref:Probable molybdenum cofactor guanylyltransferase n=1 Tax=Halobacillus karajensis TaxID=195088 RepID=A0A024P175_9BACI|nr:molybdenum cofactor guanylyltransferase [Halobacillus karajensis]CDQ19562.1 Molybdenum cofactor guanylyltransferase [Halobacillus karajensis]CDQ22024.1 Molybdenum cofactor guanylyltransferase [Halobacillus karajensis]CDQ27865.1 Molybdenum cofactor guanylyltransferase [Halobacillus karajensis]